MAHMYEAPALLITTARAVILATSACNTSDAPQHPQTLLNVMRLQVQKGVDGRLITT